MRRFTICCVCVVLGILPARSEDGPTPLLKNVSIVSYMLVPGAKDRCAINEEAWKTAIGFVANQSTKLKLITIKEHHEGGQELLDKSNQASQKLMASRTDAGIAAATKALGEAKEEIARYSAAPTLLLVAEGFEHNGSCFGHLEATVKATLEESKMIATGKSIYRPREEIWSTSQLLTAPPNGFSRFVIQKSEEMIKSFVNDWARTQREPD